ncbi:MAG: FtsB family cell division protein [Acidimicrobiales bacterium]
MVAVAVLISVATVAVPARAWWQARGEATELDRELSALEAENAELERRKSALGTELEIEQRARAEYDLVYPHEEAYAVLPPPERDAGWFHAWPL